MPQRWHSSWGIHYCHTVVHTSVSQQWQLPQVWHRCTQLCCDSSGLDSTVTAMAATLVCQRCKLTTVQQRWQWQRCNITVYTSVTAVVVTILWPLAYLTARVLWQLCGLNSTVTAMAATLVCQRCKLTTVQQRWKWQRCSNSVDTSVEVVSTDSAVTAMFPLVWLRYAQHWK